MNILKNAGTHKILAIMQGMHGESPLELIEIAGRVSHQSRDKITPDSAKKFVQMLIDRKHESVLEHSAMTVEFNNCSRGMTHELVRHRFLSITEESTRYVDESDFNVVVPPHQEQEKDAIAFTLSSIRKKEQEIVREDNNITLNEWFTLCERVYKNLREQGWPAQDARQVLPTAIKSQIVCTANFREWKHIFEVRTAKTAHWEIRRVLIGLLADVRQRVPVIFDDIVPGFTLQEEEDWK